MSKSNVALSNLRAVVIVIVLAFHSALAYVASVPAQTSPFGEAPFTWQAFPVVDPQRWMGFDVFCAWQDVSLMSLMFFLSGLLASGSLRRKGGWTYISDRLWRIGVPFVLAIIFLSPLAFYPAYLARTAQPTFLGFWQQWFSLPFWPSGPEWFLWQLLVANMLAAGLFAVAPRSLDALQPARGLGRRAAGQVLRPARRRVGARLCAAGADLFAVELERVRAVLHAALAGRRIISSISSPASRSAPTRSTAACSPATGRWRGIGWPGGARPSSASACGPASPR